MPLPAKRLSYAEGSRVFLAAAVFSIGVLTALESGVQVSAKGDGGGAKGGGAAHVSGGQAHGTAQAARAQSHAAAVAARATEHQSHASAVKAAHALARSPHAAAAHSTQEKSKKIGGVTSSSSSVDSLFLTGDSSSSAADCSATDTAAVVSAPVLVSCDQIIQFILSDVSLNDLGTLALDRADFLQYCLPSAASPIVDVCNALTTRIQANQDARKMDGAAEDGVLRTIFCSQTIVAASSQSSAVSQDSSSSLSSSAASAPTVCDLFQAAVLHKDNLALTLYRRYLRLSETH